MTIAGGMVCSDGVLLYADTQFTASTIKIHRAKQWVMVTVNPDRLQLVAAIAGDEGYARLTLHQMFLGLEIVEKKEPIRVKHVVDCLSGALLNTYGYLAKDPRGDQRDVEFLIAASTPDDPSVLLKTTGAAVDTMEGCEHIGCGWEMGTYLASKIYLPGISLSVAEALAAYILWEVKHHVPGCGGDSIIYKLTNDGDLSYRGWADIRDYERHFTDVEDRIRKFRLGTASVEMADETFEEVLQRFVNDMRLFRQARRATSQIERRVGDPATTPTRESEEHPANPPTPRPSRRDPKGRPPSQE